MAAEMRAHPISYALFLCAAACAAIFLVPRQAKAEVKLEARHGQVRAIPIAVAEFSGNGPAGEITQIISADLERSGLFKPIDPAAFLERGASVDATPSFQNWTVINAQALAVGRVSDTGDGRLKGEYRRWDVFSARQIAGEQFFIPANASRRARPHYRRCRL